jgi:hypothetical protein
MLEERADALAVGVRDRSWHPEVYLVYFSDNGQGGMTLSAALLERLARLRMGLCVNVYLFDEPDGS